MVYIVLIAGIHALPNSRFQEAYLHKRRGSVQSHPGVDIGNRRSKPPQGQLDIPQRMPSIQKNTCFL